MAERSHPVQDADVPVLALSSGQGIHVAHSSAGHLFSELPYRLVPPCASIKHVTITDDATMK